MALADLERSAYAILKKRRIDLNALWRQQTDVDLGFGIVEPHPQESLAMIFHLDEVSV
jgi:hypothetical protein